MTSKFLFTQVLLFCFLANTLFSQSTPLSNLKIGDWQQYLPWRSGKYVTASDSKVYFSTEWAVVEIDKQDLSPVFLTKVEGLSDIGVGLLRYNKVAEVLLIAYSNSNIDLWYPNGKLTNLPFIKKNIGLAGDKKIYDVCFENKTAYLACGFGVVKLNLEREEVSYTVFTNRVVRSFAVFNQNLYLATDDGLYTLPADHPNPADFGQWILLDETKGFPMDYSVQTLANFDGKLYFGSGKTLLTFDGNQLQTLKTHPTFSVKYMSTEGSGLVVGWKEQFNGEVEYYSEGSNLGKLIHFPCEATRPLYGIEDGSNKFWLADDSDDFRFYDGNADACKRFNYNSPAIHRTAEIAVAGDRILIATPGPNSQLSPPYFRDGVLIYENGQWSQFNIRTNPELQAGDCFADMWRVVPHPRQNDLFYTGSWVGGLIENKAGAVKCFTQNNSILQGAGASGSGRTAIGAMAFDADENLWLSNFGALAPIAVLKKDGTWTNFNNAPANNLLQMVIDGNGYKWFVVAFNGGILVYDSGANLESKSDDRYRLINSSNSVLPTNTVNCLTVDQNGDVWVGTQQGVVSFECGSNVFEPSCRGSRRILNIDDFNGYLLETENVITAAVDGANRKWFGTTNGIFVISPNGDAQVEKYNTANSPLFSDEIADIAINQRNGEVWIGTQNGLQTLRTTATEGGKINTRNAYAYPNPVPPDYDGTIAIYGLARDANVKITDVAGNLVYEGKSLGGQAIWDGRDYTGRRVASGVYLILATSTATFESPDAIITKVVILN